MKAKYLIAMGIISAALAGANATTSNAEEAEATSVVQDAGTSSASETNSTSSTSGSSTSSGGSSSSSSSSSSASSGSVSSSDASSSSSASNNRSVDSSSNNTAVSANTFGTSSGTSTETSSESTGANLATGVEKGKSTTTSNDKQNSSKIKLKTNNTANVNLYSFEDDPSSPNEDPDDGGVESAGPDDEPEDENVEFVGPDGQTNKNNNPVNPVEGSGDDDDDPSSQYDDDSNNGPSSPDEEYGDDSNNGPSSPDEEGDDNNNNGPSSPDEEAGGSDNNSSDGPGDEFGEDDDQNDEIIDNSPKKAVKNSDGTDSDYFVNEDGVVLKSTGNGKYIVVKNANYTYSDGKNGPIIEIYDKNNDASILGWTESDISRVKNADGSSSQYFVMDEDVYYITNDGTATFTNDYDIIKDGKNGPILESKAEESIILGWTEADISRVKNADGSNSQYFVMDEEVYYITNDGTATAADYNYSEEGENGPIIESSDEESSIIGWTEDDISRVKNADGSNSQYFVMDEEVYYITNDGTATFTNDYDIIKDGKNGPILESKDEESIILGWTEADISRVKNVDGSNSQYFVMDDIVYAITEDGTATAADYNYFKEGKNGSVIESMEVDNHNILGWTEDDISRVKNADGSNSQYFVMDDIVYAITEDGTATAADYNYFKEGENGSIISGHEEGYKIILGWTEGDISRVKSEDGKDSQYFVMDDIVFAVTEDGIARQTDYKYEKNGKSGPIIELYDENGNARILGWTEADISHIRNADGSNSQYFVMDDKVYAITEDETARYIGNSIPQEVEDSTSYIAISDDNGLNEQIIKQSDIKFFTNESGESYAVFNNQLYGYGGFSNWDGYDVYTTDDVGDFALINKDGTMFLVSSTISSPDLGERVGGLFEKDGKYYEFVSESVAKEVESIKDTDTVVVDEDNIYQPIAIYRDGKFYEYSSQGTELKTVPMSNLYVDKSLAGYYIEVEGSWYPVIKENESLFYIRSVDKLVNAHVDENGYLYFDVNGNTAFEGWNINDVIWDPDVLRVQLDDDAIEGVFTLVNRVYVTGIDETGEYGAYLVDKKQNDDGIITLTFTDGSQIITGWQNNDSVKMAETTHLSDNVVINPEGWNWNTPLKEDEGIVFSYDEKWWYSAYGIFASFLNEGDTPDYNKVGKGGPEGWEKILGGPDYSKKENSASQKDSANQNKTRANIRIKPVTDSINTKKTVSEKDNNTAVNWVYRDRAGNRVTGWQYIDHDWYYFDDDGVLQYNWLTYDGHRYYLDPDTGIRQSGWKTIDGEKYYFDEDGIMQTGWVEIDEKWYYFDENGVMQTEWLTLDDKTYYLGKDGARVTGKQTIDGKKYTFDKDGVLEEDSSKK